MLEIMHHVIIDRERCTGCGSCVEVCPEEALRLDEDEEKVVLTPELCVECGACVHECPEHAISLD